MDSRVEAADNAHLKLQELNINNRCKFKIQHGPGKKKKVSPKGFTGYKEITSHKTPTIESTATAELVNCDQRRHPKKRRNLLKWVHVETQNQQGHLNVTPWAYSTVSSKPRNTFNYTQLSQVEVGNEASSTAPRHRSLRKRGGVCEADGQRGRLR